ncbi:ABC transporter substrate-binding protein [Paenibacillus thermotolerans]|uniref:ABC transporter substrate-binding protein n=1 Tax=Paenibacillus thermotolerans TaxID=3027807 RepID=UPI00236852BC|nr:MULTISPECIES: extracellular solute-binding protein [unclassified Paenibacillus]
MVELRFVTEIQHYMHVVQEAKQSFERLHPDVNVQIQLAVDGFEAAKALESENPPDIIELGGFQAGNRDELFIDLTPYASEIEGLWEDWYPGLRQAITHGGVLPGLPLEIMMPLIMYNKEMFDRADVPYPTDDWTWDDFIELGKKLTIRDAEGKASQYGLGIGIDIEWWEPFILRNGGRYVSPDGSTAHKYVDSPATMDAFRKLIDAFRLHKIVRMPNEPSRLPEGREHEEAAMNLMFGWHFLHQQHPDQKYAVVGLPKMPGGVEANMIYMAGAHVTKKSANPRLAWEFLRHYILASRYWVLPNTKSQAIAQGLTEHPVWYRYLQELEYIQLGAFFLNRKWNASRQLINDDILRMIIDGADVAQTLRSWTRFA